MFPVDRASGQEDYVPMLLAERGELAVHGVAMRSSSPTGLGRLVLQRSVAVLSHLVVLAAGLLAQPHVLSPIGLTELAL